MEIRKIRVLMADDHGLFRDGLRNLLSQIKNVELVGEAVNGQDLIRKAMELSPDIILTDIGMPIMDGVIATKELIRRKICNRIIVLSAYGKEEPILKMLEAGASGYLLKNAGREELLAAIHAVAKGDSYFSQKVSATLLQAITRQKENPEQKKPTVETPLSDREIEVLRLITQEYSNGEIAEKLFISIRTVDTHRRNLLEKLQVKNTVGLVKYAIEKGII